MFIWAALWLPYPLCRFRGFGPEITLVLLLLFIHTNLQSIIHAEINETMHACGFKSQVFHIMLLKKKIRKYSGVKGNEEGWWVPFFSRYETDKNLTIQEIRQIIEAKHQAVLQHAGACLEELLKYKYWTLKWSHCLLVFIEMTENGKADA